MKSLKGQFLLASPTLSDPNFAKTVVLVLQHDENGAMGVVINRPSEVSVRQACEQVLGKSVETTGLLYHGGPCEQMLLVIHTREADADSEIVDGLFFTTEKTGVESLLEAESSETKFIVGYAGWGEGQLEAEFATDSWITLPATAERIFGPSEHLWTRLSTKANLQKWIDPERIPDDPSVN